MIWPSEMSSTVSVIMIELSEPAEDLMRDMITFLESRPGCRLINPSIPHIPKDLSAKRLIFPKLEINLSEQTVYQNGTAVPLSHYEFFTLCYLAKHPGWVFTRGQIYEAVWNEPGEYCNAAVSNVISQLRRKLWPENPRGGYIRTVHNSGYKFCPDSENN